jgi:hypothetical protein
MISSGVEDVQAEQIKLGSPKHLLLDELEAIHLSLYLPV